MERFGGKVLDRVEGALVGAEGRDGGQPIDRVCGDLANGDEKNENLKNEIEINILFKARA